MRGEGFAGPLKKQFDEVGVEGCSGLVAEVFAGFDERHGGLSGLRRQMIECLRDADNPGEQRDLIPGKPVRMAGTIVAFVVMGDNVRRGLWNSERSRHSNAEHRVQVVGPV